MRSVQGAITRYSHAHAERSHHRAPEAAHCRGGARHRLRSAAGIRSRCIGGTCARSVQRPISEVSSTAHTRTSDRDERRGAAEDVGASGCSGLPISARGRKAARASASKWLLVQSPGAVFQSRRLFAGDRTHVALVRRAGLAGSNPHDPSALHQSHSRADGGKQVDLDEFLKIGPRLPDEDGLALSGFLSQQTAIEKDTGHPVNLVLAAEAAVDEKLPIILDITVANAASVEPADWSKIRRIIESLRRLKNRIFLNTLTPRCIELFQS